VLNLSKVLVFLAPGFEEIETSTIVDILRRADVEVTIAGLIEDPIIGAHEMKIIPDDSIDNIDVTDFDAVICPGGSPGYINLRKNKKVITIIQKAFNSNKLVAAICASPAVLSDAGILRGKACTIYPGMEDELKKGGGIYKNKIVVVDGNIVTSKGPATAFQFSIKIVEKLIGKEIADYIGEKILLYEMA
jgi:4-methyl-5(b-hydroxyethyl)-thiazole monophosphate biosynthesis